MFCHNCGERVERNGAKFCSSCGAPLQNIRTTDLQETAAASQEREITNESAWNDSSEHVTDREEKLYYQEQFRKFDENNGAFKVTWNWAAFFFGWIWYLYKGMVGKGILYLFLLAFLAFSIQFPFVIWILTGIIGNYDYYLYKRKNTQWW
ncbi:zinc-ribbon domain-containing protein [Ectobacillus polymachus]|uniref:zinc-ribbon domain-containing protein n=1 Tax=Ectobacillus polymachus TaxID=1508806 RepID=UPI003A870022